jgi:hypothetical protein
MAKDRCRRTSGYLLHMIDCFKKAKEKGVPRQERMKSCAVDWKAMKPEKQIVYKEKAAQIKAECAAKGLMPTAPKA